MKMKKNRPERKGKNFMIMELLSYVPEFKKDVSETREKFKIDKDGFKSSDKLDKWATENDIWDYKNDYSRNRDAVMKDFPLNTFEKRMLKLGIKYRLPFNFYGLPYRGVPLFILMGEIRPPDTNYDIDFRMNGRKLLWTSLIVYASLSKAEAKEVAAYLRDIQLNLLPQAIKDIDIFAKKRDHANRERDLPLLNEQIIRSGKPKKIKSFLPGSYLDILNKRRTISVKELKKWERMNKTDIVVEYSNPTSRQIGKRHGVSGEAARQVKKRLNSLSKEFFGYDLEP